MSGHQVNLRFDEVEIDKLKEIAARNNIATSGKVEPHTKLIRDTVRAVFFSSANEQASFLEKHAYKRNTKLIKTPKANGSWGDIISQLEALNMTPEELETNWLPIIETVKKSGLDINGTPDDIFRRASKLGAIMTVVNAISAKSENVRQSAVEDLLDRAGYKPVEKRQSINVDVLPEAEARALLRSTLNELGLKLVEMNNVA